MSIETSFQLPMDEVPQDRSDSTEPILQQMYSDIDRDFAALWEREVTLSDRGPRASKTEERLAEDYTEALERERNFATRIFEAAHQMADRQEGIVTLLFDVDETITKLDFSTEEYRNITRPSFPLVVRALRDEYGDRLEVGLLSSRGQASLDEELQTPSYLLGVTDVVNPQFVISSRDSEIANGISSFMLDRHTEARQMLGDFVNPDLVKEDEMGTFSAIREVTQAPGNWSDKKVAILKQLSEENPDRGFVFVDDLLCAAVINPRLPNVIGVAIYDDARFNSLR